MSKTLESFFKRLKRTPKFFQTDHGGEFFNARVKKVFKRFKIKHYSASSILKASIAERCNRTIKNWKFKEFSYRGDCKWLSFIGNLLKRYNALVHRTIGLAPQDVNDKNELLVLSNLQNVKLPAKKKNKFRVGDTVRISKIKHVFSKSYRPSWTTELIVIDSVEKTVPVTNKLRDLGGNAISGGFYTEELLKTKLKNDYLVEKILKRRGDQIYVKWLGFDSKHNQWIKADEIHE